MSELPRKTGFIGTVFDAITGRNGISEKFVHLSELHKDIHTKESVSKYYRELRTRLGIMYALARLIHYPKK